MFVDRKKEINEEIEKLLIDAKMLEEQGIPTDVQVRQIFKLLHEYTDLCLSEYE